MNRQRIGAIATVLIALSQSLPVWGQTQQVGYYPAPELANVPGLIYDPPPEAFSPTFNQIPGATAPGNIISANPGESRAWQTGAPITDVAKFRDLEDNPQFAGFTKMSLRDFSQNIGTDIGGVPLKDIELVNGLNLEQVKTIYNNGDIKIKDSLPVVQAVIGVVFDPNGATQQVKQNALSTGQKILINKLREIESLKDVPFEDLLQGDWRGTITHGEQVLLRELGDQMPEHLRRLPIGSLTISVIEGDWSAVRQQAQDYTINEIHEMTLNEALERFPELQKIPIGSIAAIANQPLDQSLPQIADLAIENIPGLEDKFLSAVPGLGDSPIGAVLADVIIAFIAGDVFAKFDIAHSGQQGPEEFNGRPLSGGTPDNKFKVIPGIKSTDSKSDEPKKGFPRWEMKPAEPGGMLDNEPLLGKEWMDRVQKVPGCKGFLCIFGRWEPAGIKPVRQAPAKFSLGETTEYADKPSTSRVHVDFNFCITIMFTEHCIAHILSFKTPWKVQDGSLFPVLARRRVQDYFPGVDSENRTVDFCKPPTFLASASQSETAGSSPPDPDTQYGHHPYEETKEDLYEVTSVDGVKEGLTEDAAQAFEQMHADAAAQGLDIRAVSGFRDVASQEQLWKEQVASQGSPEAAAKISAPPGHSEHHTGLAVDVGTNTNPNLDSSFANTPEYAWLQENAGKYGFELSFPEGNSQGVSFEPWHWRYVGSEQAAATFSPAADDGHNHGTSTSSTPADPDHNLRQYLARIALGESNGGTNIGPNPETAAYGEYQFIPETRNTILERYGIDAWSENKAERDRAAIALIQDYGKEVGTDIIGLIEAGEFEQADQLLGQHVYSAGGNVIRYGQFTSLPGGAEESRYWSDPAILAQYGPDGQAPDAGSAPLLAGINASSQRCNPAQLASNESGQSDVVQPEGNGVATGEFINPVSGYPVTDTYGYKEWRGREHSGIDYRTPLGTPINASDGGIIEETGYDPDGYGYFVVVNHQNGYSTLYGHLSEIQVKEGQKVTKGKPIAVSGNTGFSTGPHLHFEVIKTQNGVTPRKGGTVNPELFINIYQ